MGKFRVEWNITHIACSWISHALIILLLDLFGGGMPSKRFKLLDLFCGAGGCSVGYHRAGFDVVGVDHVFQKNYPFEFHQADALEYVAEHGHEFDSIHASPPCQRYTRIAQRNVRAVARKHPHMIPATVEALTATGRPWVVENVVEARPWMPNAVTLCGSSFGLDVRRHRLFESNLLVFGKPCDHAWQTPRFRSLDGRRSQLASVVGVHGHVNYRGEAEIRKAAMGIDWMTMAELSQAIPPAYTKYIGDILMLHLSEAA